MTNVLNSLKNALLAASVATGAVVDESVAPQNIAVANNYFTAV